MIIIRSQLPVAGELISDSYQHQGICEDQVNSSPPGQNGRHFADDTFRCIFVNENLDFDLSFTEMCSHGSNWQTSISLDNGLALNTPQSVVTLS